MWVWNDFRKQSKSMTNSQMPLWWRTKKDDDISDLMDFSESKWLWHLCRFIRWGWKVTLVEQAENHCILNILSLSSSHQHNLQQEPATRFISAGSSSTFKYLEQLGWMRTELGFFILFRKKSCLEFIAGNFYHSRLMRYTQ